jgi:hypothetical protein
MKIPLLRRIWLKIRGTRHGSLSMSREKTQNTSGQAAAMAAATVGSARPASTAGVTIKEGTDTVSRNPAPDSSPPAAPSGKWGTATIFR